MSDDELPEWFKDAIVALIKQTNCEFESDNMGDAFYWKMVGRLNTLHEILLLKRGEE